MTTPNSTVEAVEVTQEQIDTWLQENCGAGLPYNDAKDEAGMLHGLAYVLRQIESTNSYKVNIGQVGPATSAIRMALEHFARHRIAAMPAVSEGEAVAWQRKHPSQGWIDCRAEDVDHYERRGQPIRPLYAHPAPTDHETLATAMREALVLIDEINERGESRRFYGIGGGTHGKLCTIRATLQIGLSLTRARQIGGA